MDDNGGAYIRLMTGIENVGDLYDVHVASSTKQIQEAARDVLGFLNEPGGWHTGGFKSKLIDAIMSADMGNRSLLAAIYPALVFAVVVYKDVDEGREWLIQQAGV